MSNYFKHSSAIVETEEIGNDTRVWAFVHILKGAKIGSNCNICDHCYIENDVVIGDNVTVKSGIYIWDGAIIEDNVFVGSDTQLVAPVKVTQGSTIGGGSTITRDTPPETLTLSRAKQMSIEGWKRPVKKPRS